MFPILFQSGNFVLASWHVFFVIAAFAAWYCLQALRPALVPEWSEGQIDRLFAGLYVSGYLGARIFSILVEESPASPIDFFQKLISFGPMTLYGGIIAVVCVLFVYCWKMGISLVLIGSFFAAPALVAIGIGRIGCYLNGDDYGSAVADQMHPPAWAVRFPNLGDSIYRYPVQLWESALTLSFGIFLIILAKRWPQRRLIFADLGVMAYTVTRFILEYYRGDERGQFFGSVLSTSQGVSLILIFVWIGVRIGFVRKTKKSS